MLRVYEAAGNDALALALTCTAFSRAAPRPMRTVVDCEGDDDRPSRAWRKWVKRELPLEGAVGAVMGQVARGEAIGGYTLDTILELYDVELEDVMGAAGGALAACPAGDAVSFLKSLVGDYEAGDAFAPGGVDALTYREVSAVVQRAEHWPEAAVGALPAMIKGWTGVDTAERTDGEAFWTMSGALWGLEAWQDHAKAARVFRGLISAPGPDYRPNGQLMIVCMLDDRFQKPALKTVFKHVMDMEGS